MYRLCLTGMRLPSLPDCVRMHILQKGEQFRATILWQNQKSENRKKCDDMENQTILDKIKEDIPKSAAISDISYEGSEIILYTTNKEFFRHSTDLIKRIVNKVKKRIEVRCDPGIVMDEEKTVEYIRKNVPEDAGIKDIYFEPEFAKVVYTRKSPALS